MGTERSRESNSIRVRIPQFERKASETSTTMIRKRRVKLPHELLENLRDFRSFRATQANYILLEKVAAELPRVAPDSQPHAKSEQEALRVIKNSKRFLNFNSLKQRSAVS